jgi:hypothetical protein
VRGNVIVDGPAAQYPKDNFFHTTWDDVAPDFSRRLHTRARPYGSEAGANVAAIERALGGLSTVGVATDSQ